MTENEKFFLCIRNWLTVFLPKQRCLSPNTIKAYKATLNLIIDFLRNDKKIPLKKIRFDIFNYSLICEFLEWTGKTRLSCATTQNSRLASLRSFFSYASMMDISYITIEQDIKKIPLKKTSGKTVDFLSRNALKVLLSTPNSKTKTGLRNQFYMILMYDTAARCQELLDLKLKDFILAGDKPYVYITGKGDKQRSIPLLKKTVKHYHQYISLFHQDPVCGNDYVFYTISHNRRNQMSPDNVAHFMKKYGKQAKENCLEVPSRVHPHQLRHTRAMHLYQDGMPLPFLSELLGHAKISTTNVYAYADTEMKRRAMEKTSLPTAPANLNPKVPSWEGNEAMILRLSGVDLNNKNRFFLIYIIIALLINLVYSL